MQYGIVEWTWFWNQKTHDWMPASPYIVSGKSRNLSEWQFPDLWYRKNIYLRSLLLKKKIALQLLYCHKMFSVIFKLWVPTCYSGTSARDWNKWNQIHYRKEKVGWGRYGGGGGMFPVKLTPVARRGAGHPSDWDQNGEGSLKFHQTSADIPEKLRREEPVLWFLWAVLVFMSVWEASGQGLFRLQGL